MTTPEKLMEEYHPTCDLRLFKNAIAKHDQEIIQMIDEAIKEQNTDKWFDKDDVCDVLIALKEKIGAK